MQDRRSVRGALVRGTPVEVVVEDGFDRTVCSRADVDGTLRRSFEALGAIGASQPDDAETGAKALFGMWTSFEDQFAERCCSRSDQACIGADAIDRPAGVTPVAGGHVLGNGRVLVIAAHAQVRGDPLALEENFDRPRGQPRFDLGASEAMGNAVIMGGDLDVIIDANSAGPPFGELVDLVGSGFSAERSICSSN